MIISIRHPGESRDPRPAHTPFAEIPAFAGMTEK
jgi:hypothetical protein